MNAYDLLDKLLVCAKAQADREGLPFDGLTSTQRNQLDRILSGMDVLGTTQPRWPLRSHVHSLNIMDYSKRDSNPYVVIAVGDGVSSSMHPYGHITDFDDLDPFTSYVESGLIGEDENEDEYEEEDEDDDQYNEED